MVNVLGLGSFLLDAARMLHPDSKDIGAAADMAGKARQAYNVVSTTSVHASANRAIIAPLVGIEAGLIHQEFMADVIGVIMLRDIVAVVSHLAMQSTVSVGVKVENVIGSINPNRGGMMALAGCENLNDNIPDPANKKNLGTEYVTVGGKAVAEASEYTPLAVGKTVQATIVTDAGKEISFPLTFRQIPIPQQNADMLRVFSAAKQEDGALIRLMMARASEISFPDFFTGKDLVKERFKIKNEDMSGFYKEALKRETGNKLTAIRTGVLSMNTMANSFVMSKDMQNQIELQTGRRFRDEASRNQIFSATNANTIVVCDEDRGMFTFYTHGQRMVETYTRKDIAIKSKKDTGSNSLADLVKLLNGGM